MDEKPQLSFRTPFADRTPTLQELLARAWPEATGDERDRALEEGRIEVGERTVRDPDTTPRPGTRITARVEVAAGESGMPDATVLQRGEGWVVVDKPAGMPGSLVADDPMHPIRFLADQLGLDRETFRPAWPMPASAAGPWLFGYTPDDAADLRERWHRGALMTTWLALVPRPDPPRGTIDTPEGHRIEYSATKIREGLAELQLTVSWEGNEPPDRVDPAAAIRDALVELKSPPIGDRRNGGFMAAGELRLRLGALFEAETELQLSWPPPEDWWPASRITPEPTSRERRHIASIDELDLPELPLRTTALDRIVRENHPWIRPSDVAGRQDHLRAGTLVRTRGTDGVYGPVAIVDDRPDISARIWSSDPVDAASFEETIRIRTDLALAARTPMFRAVAQTDLFRLVHGEADGLPGLYIDRIGPVLRASIGGAAAHPLREVVYDSLSAADEPRMIVEVESSAALGRGVETSVRTVREGARYASPDRPVVVREDGFRYLSNAWSPIQAVDPSHRSTRRILRRTCESGDRWLIAASPTTALPVTLAFSDCSEISHLRADELDIGLETMIELEGRDSDVLDPLEPEGIASVLRESDATFDGLVVDVGLVARLEPESTDSSLVELLASSMDAVVEGGQLLYFADPNALDRDLETLVSDARARANREPTSEAEFSAPDDFPTRAGFPEGVPFRGIHLGT